MQVAFQWAASWISNATLEVSFPLIAGDKLKAISVENTTNC